MPSKSQMSNRVSDPLLVSKAFRLANIKDGIEEDSMEPHCKWVFGRKMCYLTYNLSMKATHPNIGDREKLLCPLVIRCLHKVHGSNAEIEIWKEIKINLENEPGQHHVRAYQAYNEYRPFLSGSIRPSQ